VEVDPKVAAQLRLIDRVPIPCRIARHYTAKRGVIRLILRSCCMSARGSSRRVYNGTPAPESLSFMVLSFALRR